MVLLLCITYQYYVETSMAKDKKLETFEEELANDTLQTAQMILREEKVNTSLEEKHAIALFKRTLTVIDRGGLSVSDGSSVISASDNHMPVCSYLAHGSRVLVQIPPTGPDGTSHEFMNWLIHGDKDKKFTECKPGESNALFGRTVSSHSTRLETDSQDYCFIEEKGVVDGTIDTISGFGKTLDRTHHFGINFAFGVDKLGMDSRGKEVRKPDGEHGHMYLHYRPPSEHYPGSLMIGVENSQPGKSNHSLLGTPNATTHLGGGKLSELQRKYDNSVSCPVIMIPSTLNGMRIDLDRKALSGFVSGQEQFEVQCLIRPPKVQANVSRHKLVNRHLGCRRDIGGVTLAEMMAKDNSGDIDLKPVLLGGVQSKSCSSRESSRR